MYFAVHSKTIEIQFELSKFIKSIILFPVVAETGPIVEVNIVKAKKHYSEFSELPETVWSFQALNMGSEIGRVLTSVMNLNKEIMEFDFLEIPKTKWELDITSSSEVLHKRRDNVTTVLESVNAVLSVTTSSKLKKHHHTQDQ